MSPATMASDSATPTLFKVIPTTRLSLDDTTRLDITPTAGFFFLHFRLGLPLSETETKPVGRDHKKTFQVVSPCRSKRESASFLPKPFACNSAKAASTSS